LNRLIFLIIGILFLITTGISFGEENTISSLRDSIQNFHQNNEFEKALELTESTKDIEVPIMNAAAIARISIVLVIKLSITE